MIKNPSVVRRLIDYALFFRKKLIIALLILVISVAAQLSGPYIVKIIIDQHINAIVDLNYYQLNTDQLPEGIRYTSFQDKAYIRSDWIAPSQVQSEWTEVS